MLAGCSLFTELGGFSDGEGVPATTSDGGTNADGPAVLGASEGGSEAGSVTPCAPSGTVETVTASPGVVADDGRVGTLAWGNTSGALAAKDGKEAATPEMIDKVVTHWLVASGYGIVLPPGALVRGFSVGVVRYAGSTDEIGDYGVALIKGTTIGAPKSNPGAWPKLVARADYGGPADLWGDTWTATDVTAPTFGVAVAAKGLPAYYEPAYVDHIEVTVHFERCQ